MTKTNKFGFFLILILFQGCILHPKYERPPVDIPEHFRLSVDEAASYANCSWWEQLEDPVLNDLIIEALTSNYDLKVAIVRVKEFFGNLLIARSPLYPQINGLIDYSRQKNARSLTPLLFNNLFDDFLTVSYEVDIWGKIRSGSEAALAELLASIEARQGVVLTLVSSVVSTYVTLRQYDKQLIISNETYESRKYAYDIAKARFLGGITSELEAKQAEAEMETALVAISEFNILIAETENLLSVLVGHPPESITRGVELQAFALPIEIPVGIPAEILEQRPDILQAEQNFIAANAMIGVARANFFPNISLTGLYGNRSLELHNLLTGPNVIWQYAASLLQPIFTGWELTGELEEAEAIALEAYYAYFQVVLNAFQEVNDALISYQETQEIVKTLKRRVAILEEVLELATLQYNNGEVDYLNVLNAQSDLFSAELNLTDSEARVLLSLVDIYKSLGGGWVVEADAVALNGLYP